MSAENLINIRNPSRKPLPALPTGRSISNLKSTISLPSTSFTPIQGSSDVSLDSISLGHLRNILKQSLHNCALDTNPWETVIWGIILDIAETVPKAIEAIYQHEMKKQKIQNKFKDESKFVITLKKDGGKPTDSHFVYNYFDGELLFKRENDEELMVYVVCNLRLEVCLFRDHFISRDDTKDGQGAEDIQNRLRNSRRTSKSSWLGWLMKHNNMSNIRDHVNKSHEKHGSLMRKSSFKRNQISKSSNNSTGATINTEEEMDMSILAKNKFAKAIHQMENTILSSSPGVKFPPPHVLMRLRDEETEIRLHTNEDGTFKSFAVKDALDLANDFSNGNGAASTKNSTGKYRTYAAITGSSQVSQDFRSGLTYLMTNNNSLNCVFKHQALSCSFARFWSPTSISPCHNHEITTMEYYNKNCDHPDRCLGEIINLLCDQAHEICEDASCDHPGLDHISTYTHNTGRISITIEELPDQKLKPLSDSILMWTQCEPCSMKTPIVQMSRATYLYSFGKYLENLIYNEDFTPKTLCSHFDSLVRCFRRGDLVVKIGCEHVDLFEMRLPKLQISQGETPIIHTLGEAEEIDKLFVISNEDEMRLFDETRLEITYFYGGVKQHITALEEYFDSLSPNETDSSSKGNIAIKVNGNDADPSEEQSYLKLLDDMAKDFRVDEFELYDILKETKATVLNDVRKLFVEKIHSTKKRLLDWQKAHVREENLEKFSNIEWVEPEYASSSNCHVFPGSPIIVREDEPSSIIAFTLSSRDYLRESSLMRQNVRLSFTQSAPVTPMSEYHQPQVSNSFSTLITSLKSPSTSNLTSKKDLSTDSEGSNGLQSLDQYSSTIRRKHVKDNTYTIPHGFDLGSFNLSLSSKEKKKDPEKEAEKQTTTKNGKFGGIFGQKNEDSEKAKDEIFNEKAQHIKEEQKPESVVGTEKLSNESNEKQDVNEKDLPKKKDESTFSWGRKTPKEKETPHLKYQFTHGTKKFSCTVYYATEFDSLRRRCGIENLSIDSLSRCSSWKVTGGKSSSNFFKTQDDRLIIKQMVSSWRIGEKEALLKFAPKYFEYMNKAPITPSVLAKIFGFYTIKIKDLKKNSNIIKMDVLVMEHLFFEKTITSKFDLKGIQERHIRDQPQQGDVTLWDGDWVEGRYKSRLLIHSHSKKILREAILNDTKFLADSNIMDYSLLVGVDGEKKELIAGIVDFIGAYTLYKKIENRGKTIGRNAKEVTVLPPDQYKDRFRDSIDQYFLAVPGEQNDK
ncbi:7915_t:CDS:2 [Funneliformis mosseae]|uniref:7915_t:CDS:1 n=1 Tax=Funneliformis mosseae TaxID=27381 RepID=A0A9N9A3J8_FUNMO|nr:7915_t:CDS:2 [Funneliformis mosseae]